MYHYCFWLFSLKRNFYSVSSRKYFSCPVVRIFFVTIRILLLLWKFLLLWQFFLLLWEFFFTIRDFVLLLESFSCCDNFFPLWEPFYCYHNFFFVVRIVLLLWEFLFLVRISLHKAKLFGKSCYKLVVLIADTQRFSLTNNLWKTQAHYKQTIAE